MIVELSVVAALGIVVFIFASRYDVLEYLVDTSRNHEDWELDEFLPVAVYLIIALSIFSSRRWLEVRKSELLLKQKNEELSEALSEIRHLRGILPICANCKKIRDDKGYWHQVESYIQEHSLAEFSHSICPDCLNQLYPEFSKEE